MLTLRRLAELATMVLVAVPLVGCGNAENGAPAAGSPADTMSQKLAGADDGANSAQDMAPAEAVAMDRIGRIEGRHFDLYRHYRAHAAAGADDESDDDSAGGAVRHAVISFSASSLSQALRGCSMRSLMALD